MRTGFRAASIVRRLACLLLASAVGCTQSTPPPPAIPVEAAAQLPKGAVGLWALPPPEAGVAGIPQPKTPGQSALTGAGEAALGTAGTGVGAGLYIIASTPAAVGTGPAAPLAGAMILAAGLGVMAAGIVLAPVAALIGSGVGGAKGTSAEDRETALAAMHKVLADWTPGPDLVKALAMVAPKRTVACRAANDCKVVDGPPVATILFLQPHLPSFSADEGEIDPDLTLLVQVDAELRDAATGAVLLQKGWSVFGATTPFSELAANDAVGLQYQLNGALTEIASTIAYDLFGPPTGGG